MMQTRGKFQFYFITRNHQSTTHVLDDSETTFKMNSHEQRLVSLENPLDEDITDVFISFEKTTSLMAGWLYWDSWSFEYVEVFKGDTQISGRYCPYTPIIKTGSTVRFTKC